jgi:hypothetical protein
MPEGTNVEVAHKLTEREHDERRKRRWEEVVEILEAAVLALVAIATAYSGYQAAKWDGHQAFLYGISTKYRVEAGVAATEGGQQRLLDVSTFNTWIEAKAQGQEKLAALYVRRFSPEYRAAFRAWIAIDPLTNPNTPPGPSFMPQYHNALLEQADRLNTQATAAFEEGTMARDTAEDYVRGTVLLATVLFMIALSQRFKLRNVRIGTLVVATALFLIALVSVVTYPHL